MKQSTRPRGEHSRPAEEPYESFIKQRPHSVKGVRRMQAMLIPSASLVDAYIRKIPRGATVDLATLRKDLAERHGADATCPVTVRRHLRALAEAGHSVAARALLPRRERKSE